MTSVGGILPAARYSPRSSWPGFLRSRGCAMKRAILYVCLGFAAGVAAITGAVETIFLVERRLAR
jgi:hypothetical protein